MPDCRTPDIVSAEMRAGAIGRLHSQGLSCVIVSPDGSVTECRGRGVSDLYRILTESPSVLRGAFVADKIIGKGAAALLVAGCVAEVWTDVISRPALGLLRSADVTVGYTDEVPAIINRAGTGICPVESLCASCSTAAECLPLIGGFLAEMKTSSMLKKPY